MMNEKFNRLKHKKESATTFRRFDEVGMFEVVKKSVSSEDGSLNKKKMQKTFLTGLSALLIFLFSTIFIVRLAFSIPL